MPNTKPTTDDPFIALRKLMDKPLNDWKPEKAGDRVLGTVVELTEVEGTHSRYPVVLLDVGKRLERVACGRSVLESEIRGRDIREGDLLGIEYSGEKTSLAGKNYHSYRVMHQPALRDEAPRLSSATNTAPADEYGFDMEETF